MTNLVFGFIIGFVTDIFCGLVFLKRDKGLLMIRMVIIGMAALFGEAIINQVFG